MEVERGDLDGERPAAGGQDQLAALVERLAQIYGDRLVVALAQRRLGSKAEVLRANLAGPLSGFEDGAFDGVLSALVLDYIRDWGLVLGEFHRLLKRAGWPKANRSLRE